MLKEHEPPTSCSFLFVVVLMERVLVYSGISSCVDRDGSDGRHRTEHALTSRRIRQ